MSSAGWISGEQHTIPSLLEARLESDPDSEYLDVCGVEVHRRRGRRPRLPARQRAGRRSACGPATGWPRLIENSPEAMLAWWGAVRGGVVAVPVNTAYKGAVPAPPARTTPGASVLIVAARASSTGPRRSPTTARPRATSWSSTTRHRRRTPGLDGVETPQHAGPTCSTPTPTDAVGRRSGPSDLGHVRLHRRHHRPVEGLHAQPQLPRGRSPARSASAGGAPPRTWCGPRCRCSTSTRIVTAVLGAAGLRRPVGDLPPLLGVELLAGDEPDRRHDHLDARHDGVPAGPRRRPARRCRGRARPRPTPSLRLHRRRAAAGRGRHDHAGALRRRHLQRRLRRDRGQPDLVAAAGRARTSPTPPASSTTSTSTSASSTTTTTSCPRGTDGEIVIRPKRPHVMFEGYWGRPEATVETSRNWWYHTGDIGRIDDEGFLYFVDRKADYLRRRGENISSFEVERILMAPRRAGRRRRARRAERADRGRPQDHRDARGGRDPHRGGALPLVASTSCRTSRCPATSSSAPSCPAARSAGCSSASCATRASPPPTWDVEASGITYEKR